MAPRSRSRRLIRALATAGILLLALAGPAWAQDDGSDLEDND